MKEDVGFYDTLKKNAEPWCALPVHIFSPTFLARHTFAAPVERVKAAWVG